MGILVYRDWERSEGESVKAYVGRIEYNERARKVAAAQQGRHLCDGLREKVAARTANASADIIGATSTTPTSSACTDTGPFLSDRAPLEDALFERLVEQGLA
ncbi:MAG: hypothetical protein ACI4SV_06015 [Duodenibacillus sp.]